MLKHIDGIEGALPPIPMPGLQNLLLVYSGRIEPRQIFEYDTDNFLYEDKVLKIGSTASCT